MDKTQMKNIFLLPTDKPSKLKGKNMWSLCLSSKLLEWRFAKHIYITSEEEIKSGDWIYCSYSNTIHKDYQMSKKVCCKKIILSTDQLLHSDGVQSINNGFIKWLIENPKCEHIEVQHIRKEYVDDQDAYGYDVSRYKIIIPIEKQVTILEGECRGIYGGCFLDSCGHDCGCFKKVSLESDSAKKFPLEIEAKQYAGSKSSSDAFIDTHIRDFISGANSKFVNRQRIESIIWVLEELRNIDTIKYIDPKIDELQEKLKKIS